MKPGSKYYPEKNMTSSHLSNSSEDSFGVSWGEERPSYSSVNEVPGKPKHVKYYLSFYLANKKYVPDDTVYLHSAGGPPYIARIGSLYENVKTKEKHMHVRWFCRPCELPAGLPDVDYSKNCKEVFLMYGDAAGSVNSPASTIRHCTILCTAGEPWNRNYPSVEDIAAADHIFDRAFNSGKLQSLDLIVKQFGEHLVTGIRGQIRVAREANGEHKGKGLGSGKKAKARGIHLDQQPIPRAMYAASDLPSQNLDREQSKGSTVLGLPSQNNNKHQFDKTSASLNLPLLPLRVVGEDMENLARRSSPSAFQNARHKPKEARSTHVNAVEEGTTLQAAHPSIKRTCERPVRKDGAFDLQKRQRVDRSGSSLSQQRKPESKLPFSGVAEARVKPLSEHSTPDQQIASRFDSLNKERRGKNLELVNKPKISELKKRLRVHLDLENDKDAKSRLNMSKLNFPPRIVPIELKHKRPKVEEKGFRSITNSPKSSDVRCPKVAEKSLCANDSSWQHLHGPVVSQSPIDGKHDSRGSAPQIGDRHPAKVSNENIPYQDTLQIQSPPITQSIGLDHDVKSLPPKVGDNRSPVGDNSHSDPTWEESQAVRNNSTEEESRGGVVEPLSSHAFHPKYSLEGMQCMYVEGHGTEVLSSLHQKVANMNHRDSEWDMKLSHGKVPREVGLPKCLKKNRLSTNESEQNVEVVEPKVIISGSCKSLSSSQRECPSLVDFRHGEVGSSQKASKKSLGSQLDISVQLTKSLRKSGTQPIKQHTKLASEGLMLNEVRKAKGKPTGSPDIRVDECTPRQSPRGLVDNIAKLTIEERMPKPVLNHSSVPPSDEDRRELFEPKESIFNFPWQESLRISRQQGKALLLENLDPGFSSFEIEAMLKELLQVSCDVRMLPPKNFTSYTSGQAVVLFETKNAAVGALRNFTENWLIWSKDERPVLASMVEAETSRSNSIHGFFDAAKFGTMSVFGKKNSAIATSHCSQPNTVEYEMGLQWRLLQDRHAEAWSIAAQEHNLAADRLKTKHERN